VSESFWPPNVIDFTGGPLYEEFFGIICHSLLYFAINELLCPAPTCKKSKISKIISGV